MRHPAWMLVPGVNRARKALANRIDSVRVTEGAKPTVLIASRSLAIEDRQCFDLPAL